MAIRRYGENVSPKGDPKGVVALGAVEAIDRGFGPEIGIRTTQEISIAHVTEPEDYFEVIIKSRRDRPDRALRDFPRPG